MIDPSYLVIATNTAVIGIAAWALKSYIKSRTTIENGTKRYLTVAEHSNLCAQHKQDMMTIIDLKLDRIQQSIQDIKYHMKEVCDELKRQNPSL